MSLQTNSIYEFEQYRLDFSEKILSNGRGAIPLTPKVFDTLCVLVENAGHLIEKDELMQKLWPDRFVEESNLTFNIKMLRKALGDNAQKPQFIETVQSRGYRFIAKVNEVSETGTVAENPFARATGSVLRYDQSVSPPVAVKKAPARLILFIVGFATAFFLILILSFNFRPSSSVGSNDIKSIGVLPIKPLTADNREPVFELGIADSLILKLSSANDLIVRPLTAMRKYADVDQDAIAAGREQKVDYVLASNYQIADGKIRITSQLINVLNGQVEGAFKVEQENSTIFSVQDAVAANIAGPLLRRLNRQSNNLTEKQYTNNEEAYRLYIQGTVLADKRDQEAVRKAIEYFEQAVRHDPNYALAYARLANALTAMALNHGGDTQEQYLKAKIAIEKALAIDDNLAEAHSYLGEIKSDFEWDFAGAEREHRKAIELNPDSSVAHRMYAILLIYLGRHDESIAESKIAIDLEPASVLNQLIFGRTLFFARRYDEAITALERTAEMDPDFFFAHLSLYNAYRFKGDGDRAFESFTKAWTLAGEKPDEINLLKRIYAGSGWPGIYKREFEKEIEAEKKGKPNYNSLAWYSIELGLRDKAFAYLEKTIVQRRWQMVVLRVHPRYDPLRSDSRFNDLVKSVGLP